MTDDKLEKMLNTALTPYIEDDEITVDFEKRKEPELIMGKSRYKKIILIAACTCLFTGTAVFAGSKIKYLESHSSASYGSNGEYTKYNDLTDIEKEAGYEIDIVEKFNNGYEFEEFSLTDTSGIDEDGNSVVSFKEIFVFYKNADGKRISLSTTNTADYNEPGDPKAKPDEVRNISGITVERTVFRQKLNAPEDYKLTDEEKELDAAGKFWQSFDGGSEMSDYDIAVVTWEKNGIKYNLIENYASESADSLFDMAKQLIEQ